MKTYNDITHVNFNDVSFITGKTPNEAKEIIAGVLKIEYLTPKGAPKVSAKDQAPVNKIDFTMKSNSNLEGKDRLKYLCDYYNKGCDLNTLRLFGEHKQFIKKLKFTGKYDILNHILNREQYQKLQQIWLFGNVYGKTRFSEEVIRFIEKNKWTEEFLKSRGISTKNKLSKETEDAY